MYGYKGENHSVTTDDGYILIIHRVPNTNPNAIPILLMHGSASSSVTRCICATNEPYKLSIPSWL
uniref:Partial AB-hydrolase lipase domain-containing protein n=1 Tax=Strigamia maritima TaxID=126957 RepID=T1JIU6_STRMM